MTTCLLAEETNISRHHLAGRAPFGGDRSDRAPRRDKHPQSSDRQRVHVLLVDDDRDIFPFVQALLDDVADGEYLLTWTDSYAQGVRTLRESPPDAALIDYRLGTRTGLELIAETAGVTPTPMIVLTGQGDRETDRFALRLGASDYLEKHELTGEILERTIRYAVERRRSAEALRASEAKLRAFFDAGLVGIAFGDSTGRILESNQKFLDIVGYSRHELAAGAVQWSILELRESGRAPAAFEKIRQHGYSAPFEAECLRKDGSRIWVLVGLSPVPNDAEQFAVFVLDITASRQAQRALAESQRKFSLLFQSSPAAIYLADLESGRIIEANPRFAELTGYPIDEVIGRSTFDLDLWTDAEARRHLVTRAVNGEIVRNIDMKVRRRSGEIRDALVSVESVVYEKTGRQVLIGLITDITDLRLLEEKFRQAQKMEALGRLAGGVAHDFNNLLLAIIGYADLVLSQPELPARVLRNVSQIGNAGRRAATLTRQLLAFSRRTILEPRVLDLNAVVRNMQSLLRRLLGEDVSLETQLAPDLAHVNADPGQLDQIIMNLAVNARDAMPHGGRLRIETGNILVDQAYVDAHPGASIGPHVMLAVSDTGIGMDDTVKARLFEPFFTTKEQGKGTGLGLATVYGAVKQNGGSIWVQSEPELGCTFTVFLPVVDQPLAIEPPAARDTGLAGTETIVLVEDHEHAREFARDVLTRHGYAVHTAIDPKAAVELLSRLGPDVSLLLTDVVMPHMNGRDLARLCVQQNPHIRVLYMSGYASEAIVTQGTVVEGIAWIQKPFVALDLLHKVRAVLDADQSPTV